MWDVLFTSVPCCIRSMPNSLLHCWSNCRGFTPQESAKMKTRWRERVRKREGRERGRGREGEREERETKLINFFVVFIVCSDNQV